MIKKILLPLFLLAISIVVYLLVTETIVRTVFFLEEINSSDMYDPFLNNWLRHLTPQEISKLTLKYTIEISQLSDLKSSAIVGITICGIAVIALIAFKPDFSVKKFDGLAVMSTYMLLICATYLVFNIFMDGKFTDGHNATIGIRAAIEIILLVVAPLIFFISLKMNQFEVSSKMHEAKWITRIALILTVVSGLIALVIGIAFLSTPDVSTFTS